ncbi:MAG TPA: helix-turn-helix domain-containing protein [Mycobacteriales bacterium]|nr:helix-turn-helix domain-containing protein [Mycobacteriales bacterium]
MGVTERRRIQRAFDARPDVVADALLDAVTAEIPAYRLLAPPQLAEVRAIASWALRRIVELWVDGGSLTAEDLARFRGVGAARALDGRPLPVVLRAYRVAATRSTDLVVAQGGGRLDVEDMLSLVRLWLASVDALSEAVYAGYAAASGRLTGDRERALRDLLDDLLTGRQTSPSALADRCRELDVTLPSRPCLLVAGPAGAEVPPAAVAPVLAALLPVAGGQAVLSGVRGGRLVAVLPGRFVLPGGTGAMAAAVGERGWRGCAVGGFPLAEVIRAYRLAVDALDLAPAHAFEGRPLLAAGDAQVVALLAARTTARPADVVSSVLGGLVEPGAAHLLDGLGAFLATGSATAAAESLHLHPQTLRYRLRRVTALTGRDPRRPWDRLVLDVARTLAGFGPD